MASDLTCSERASCRCDVCRAASKAATDDAWAVLDELAAQSIPASAEWTISHACLMRLRLVWQAGTDTDAQGRARVEHVDANHGGAS